VAFLWPAIGACALPDRVRTRPHDAACAVQTPDAITPGEHMVTASLPVTMPVAQRESARTAIERAPSAGNERMTITAEHAIAARMRLALHDALIVVRDEIGAALWLVASVFVFLCAWACAVIGIVMLWGADIGIARALLAMAVAHAILLLCVFVPALWWSRGRRE
jgi:hypothetical protein